MNNDEIARFISDEKIDISNRTFGGKHDIFAYLTGLLLSAGCIGDAPSFLRALCEREDSGSTYMGNGIAIPHGKSETVREPSAAFCRCRPFQYDPEDEEPTHLVLMLAIPEHTEQTDYIAMLAKVSTLFVDEDFLDIIEHENSKETIISVFQKRLANENK